MCSLRFCFLAREEKEGGSPRGVAVASVAAIVELLPVVPVLPVVAVPADTVDAASVVPIVELPAGVVIPVVPDDPDVPDAVGVKTAVLDPLPVVAAAVLDATVPPVGIGQLNNLSSR